MQSDKHNHGGCHDSSEEKLGQPCSPWRDQSWLHGGHPQAHEGRCVPALMIGLTALVLCFLGGNQSFKLGYHFKVSVAKMVGWNPHHCHGNRYIHIFFGS